MLPEYAELFAFTNFSFLRGASHGEELVLRASQLGYSGLAITDECSLAGVVRAHVEAKKEKLPLVIGSYFQLVNADRSPAFGLILLAQNREGYGIIPALDTEPHIVITGRVADPSLFLAPIAHRNGWKLDDWMTLGAGTVVGHLLECTSQVTGGYFADPPYKEVPNLAYVGFPLAEVQPDGSCIITKLDGTGGFVNELTVKEQLLYEVHDPRAYLTPDVTADFTNVQIEVAGKDRVAVRGGIGRERPAQLKTIVGFDGGFLAEAGISYAGPGAENRARLAASIIEERMRNLHGCADKIRLDLIGINSLHATAIQREAITQDVRVRAAMRTTDREMAETLLSEVESLWVSGPAGGGGYRGNIDSSVKTHAVFVNRDAIETKVEVLQS